MVPITTVIYSIGDDGLQGDKGQKGETGADGLPGFPGRNLIGQKGHKGEKGSVGLPGEPAVGAIGKTHRCCIGSVQHVVTFNNCQKIVNGIVLKMCKLEFNTFTPYPFYVLFVLLRYLCRTSW